MKAIVRERYGPPDVLRLKDVPEPVPSDDEVLIRVHAVSINGSDRENLRGKPLYARLGGLTRPRHQLLGSDVAGRVEQVGSNIREFRVGDEVFGELPGYHGGFAQYACAPERTLARKPAGLTFEQAAAIPQAGVIALRATRDRAKPGQHILINGAGGSAGAFAVQLAKMFGAEVTGVDNPHKLDFVRSLGADHVIDYTREDFTRSAQAYDLVVDVIAHRSAFAAARALRPGGTYLIVGGPVRALLQSVVLGPLIRRATGKAVRLLIVPQGGDDLVAIADLCEAGTVVPVIDRVYPLSEAPEALRYVDQGLHKGKVVISVTQ